MEIISLIMSTMDQIFDQVFTLSQNETLKQWGLETVEKIAANVEKDMVDQGMANIEIKPVS